MPNEVIYTCKYAPVELLEGFAAHPVYMDWEAQHFEVAEALAHPNLCGYAKNLLNYVQQTPVKALVLTSCCDAMRRCYDILAASGNIEFLYLIDLPFSDSKAALTRLEAQLIDLAQRYEAWSGTPFDIARASLACMRRETLDQDHIALVGAHAPSSLVQLSEELSCLPVENLTCSQIRTLEEPPRSLWQKATAPACETPCCGTPEDDIERFVHWYAKALMQQTPCARMSFSDRRSELFENSHQKGLIYHTMKFCDFYPLEYQQLTTTSSKRILKLETDGTPQSSEQLKNRIEAFVETLTPAKRTTTTAKEDLQRMSTTGSLLSLGLDSGSTSTEAVIMNQDGHIVAKASCPTGATASKSAKAAIDAALQQAGLTRDDIAITISCGYGKQAIDGVDLSLTEITCHAKGAAWLFPNCQCVIDIGGQDSKVIALDQDQQIANFVMNDKCAAGTGRFLEAMARTLEMNLEHFSKCGLSWNKDVTISSMCTVFAESEVVGLVAQNTDTQDIVHGLSMAVATKTKALVKRAQGHPPYVMTGGVAQNKGVVKALSTVLKSEVKTHEDSQYCGAIGAALLGLETLNN